MTDEMADPGQDLRGAPDADSLWTILDLNSRWRRSKVVSTTRIPEPDSRDNKVGED
jgi:hypothetical protein